MTQLASWLNKLAYWRKFIFHQTTALKKQAWNQKLTLAKRTFTPRKLGTWRPAAGAGQQGSRLSRPFLRSRNKQIKCNNYAHTSPKNGNWWSKWYRLRSRWQPSVFETPTFVINRGHSNEFIMVHSAWALGIAVPGWLLSFHSSSDKNSSVLHQFHKKTKWMWTSLIANNEDLQIITYSCSLFRSYWRKKSEFEKLTTSKT